MRKILVSGLHFLPLLFVNSVDLTPLPLFTRICLGTFSKASRTEVSGC